MTHDVFISHSTLDKLAADAVCHGLEAKGVRCWIAPRDQIAGKAYGQQITEAIETAQVMVLVFSEHVNDSQAVLNEINLAAAASVTIVPFRIASVAFNPELNYYLGRMHWLDAFPQPVDAYIDALADDGAAQPAAGRCRNGACRGRSGSGRGTASPSPPSPSSPLRRPPDRPPRQPRRGARAGRHNVTPVLIVGLVLAFVLAIVLIGAFHKPSPRPRKAKPPSSRRRSPTRSRRAPRTTSTSPTRTLARKR